MKEWVKDPVKKSRVNASEIK